jgi:hypothetical protein
MRGGIRLAATINTSKANAKRVAGRIEIRGLLKRNGL